MLRTARKRISVGSASDNDLVLPDPGISPRHFLVLIDGAQWRIHTLSEDQQLTLDRRWTHPISGRRGALIHAGRAVLLLFPGELEQEVLDRELRRYAGGGRAPEAAVDGVMVTSIHAKPVEFSTDDFAEMHTVAVDVGELSSLLRAPSASSVPPSGARVERAEPPRAIAVEGRSGERMAEASAAPMRPRSGAVRPVAPSVLRERGASGLVVEAPSSRPGEPQEIDPWEERTVGLTTPIGGSERAPGPRMEPVIQPADVEGRTLPPQPGAAVPRSSWERARKAPPRPIPAIPEVLAEPESQIIEVRPQDVLGHGASRRPARDEAVDPRGVRGAESAAGADRRPNAWGDADAQRREDARAPLLIPVEEPPERPRDGAWGAEPPRPSHAAGPQPGGASPLPNSRGAPAEAVNAWGDRTAGGSPVPRADPAANAWGETSQGGRAVAPGARPAASAPTARPAQSTAWGEQSQGGGAAPAHAWGEQSQSGRSGPVSPRSALTRGAPGEVEAWGEQSQGGRNLASVPKARALVARPEPGGPGQRLALDALALRGSDAALAILREPDGRLATQIRLLGARIESLSKTNGYRAFMITSAEPLTGKTTAALNLAFALSEDTRRRVALVEANFRYPRFAELLGIDPNQGVVATLEGRATLSESVVKVGDRNLLILPAGTRHARAPELLSSPRFKTLIAELVNTVDVALIDAPAVKPFADTNLLLPMVDGAFFVAAHRITRGIWLSQATEQLGPSRVLGALYNHLPAKQERALAKARRERLRQRT